MITLEGLPPHPALIQITRRVAQKDRQSGNPNRIRLASEIFRQAQGQLINNCYPHTFFDNDQNPLASILVTHVSTHDLTLPQINTHRNNNQAILNNSGLSSSEVILNQAHGRDLSVGIIPGFAFPGNGGGPFNDANVRQAINLIGYALARGEDVTVFLHGLTVGSGSKITDLWVEGLPKKGFQQHGELYADVMRKNMERLGITQEPIVLYGESMGGLNAKLAAQELASDGKEVTVYMQNPPGPDNNFPLLVKQAQVVAGFIGEGLVRRLITTFFQSANPTPKEIEPFFAALEELLISRGITQTDRHEQKLLKRRAARIDLHNLLGDLPFSTQVVTGPGIVDTGWMDPTNFTITRAEQWIKGERQFETTDGVTHRLSDFAHTPEYTLDWLTTLAA